MSRARISFLFVALIALTSAFAACGGGSDDPQSVVEEATLQGIESGKVDATMSIDTQGAKGGKVNVEISGPFQGESGAELPESDLAFSVKGDMGEKKIDLEGGFTLLGNKAYVGYEGTEYEVDSTTFNFVKSMLKQQGAGRGQADEDTACQDAVGELDLNDFVEGIKGGGSADFGGTSTTKVSGDLNAPAALEAVSKLVEDPACNEQLQATGQLPSAAELDKAKSTVKDSVKSAHVDLYVGDDHIVRRIVAQVTIEPPKGSDGSAERVDVDLDVALTGVNEEQTISAPRNAKPLSNLFLKLGINPIELLDAFQGGAGAGGIGGLLEGLDRIGGSGGGKESYSECLGEANTPVDIQDCTGLLQ